MRWANSWPSAPRAHRPPGFVPITEERYLLVCLKTSLDLPAMQRLLAHLRSADWAARLSGLAGYAPDHCGEVAAMKRLLPWWD